MTHNGKIGRLPHTLRDEVCRRLLDWQTGPELLKWLNKQPEAMAIYEAHFEGVPVSNQNLSEWRKGGFAKWVARRERVENLKTLSSFAHDLAQSGGSLADGAASIVAGQILEALEEVGNLLVTGGSDDAEKDPNDGLVKIAGAVSALQRAGTAAKKQQLDERRIEQKDQSLALDREKFEVQTISKFLEWAKQPEALAILNSGKSKAVQMDKLRELMFGTA